MTVTFHEGVSVQLSTVTDAYGVPCMVENVRIVPPFTPYSETDMTFCAPPVQPLEEDDDA